ncbi:hypothetical protein [Euzebyella saccharophila]|uniref:Uncharacterized protein n=1 Tax=Euzebyella saccharophila TaxID=679664 RepID=A0ABV8JP58_9FLAO|nr:hypothetical protein [Euzebyella saccharophila]
MTYFLAAAILGVLLRFFSLASFEFDYRYVVHAHSHIALLGWVYIALTTIIYKLFLEKRQITKKYRRLFGFTQVTIIGMLLTFPFQGYALFSILFSTLFLFASYRFLFLFEKYAKIDNEHGLSFKCLRWALWYMALSSLGPWALGGIMTTLGVQSIWYRLAIYFYLHFQYNGWMVLSLVGLFVYVLEQNKLIIPKRKIGFFFWGLNAGIVLTYFLSVLWIMPPTFFYILGGLGALLQIGGILVLVDINMNHFIQKFLSPFQWLLLRIVLLLFSIKMLLQLVTAFPYFANLAATYLDFTIGYLHWTFLGVITVAIFFLLDYFRLLKIDKSTFIAFFTGFVTLEVLIFYKGISGWLGLPGFDFHILFLAVASLVIALSIMIMLWKFRSAKVDKNP